MVKEVNGLYTVSVKGHEEAMEVMKRLTDVAQPGSVYGEPVTVGDHTVITASEVSVGLGFGYGMGGAEPSSAATAQSLEAKAEVEGQEAAAGGLGGGGSSARPVAVIHINSEGVRIEPVVDVTKLALAFLTMLGSIFLMGAKMRKKAKGI